MNIEQNNNDADFIIGDVVALTETRTAFASDDLFEIVEKADIDNVWVLRSSNDLILALTKELRHATIAEIQAKRRLPVCEILTDEDIAYHASSCVGMRPIRKRDT